MVKIVRNQDGANGLTRTEEVGPPPAQHKPKLEAVTDGVDLVGPRLLAAHGKGDSREFAAVMNAYLSSLDDVHQQMEAVQAISNFLLVFGGSKEKPALYPNLFERDPAKLFANDRFLDHFGPVIKAIANAHRAGQIDLLSGDYSAARALYQSDNLGATTDGLKPKMTAWAVLNPVLKTAESSFELGIRKLPTNKEGESASFLTMDGIGRGVGWVKNFRLSADAVNEMRKQATYGGYPKEVWDYFLPPLDDNGVRKKDRLSQFERDVRSVKIEAVPDGETYVGGPMLRLTGLTGVAEYVETNLMRYVNSQTSAATVASQFTLAAGDKPVLDFSLRRVPGGEDSAMAISLGAHTGGMAKTSNLMASLFGLNITGTMEHSAMMLQKLLLRLRPPEWKPELRRLAEETLRSVWSAQGLSGAEVVERVKAQTEDVLREAWVFRNMAFEYDRATSVALVDTSHPNVGAAATMVAQQMVWDELGKGSDNQLRAIRLDSGNLLAQGLLFRRVFNEAGMGHINVIATDGLSPVQIRFYEDVEKTLKGAKDGELPAAFFELMASVPKSVAKTDEEKDEITRMAKALVASPSGIGAKQAIFSAYGAGEKVGDSVATIGALGIIYKAARVFGSLEDGARFDEPLGKLAEPHKSTGPARALYLRLGPDGKIAEYVIASPHEQLPKAYQPVLRTVYDGSPVAQGKPAMVPVDLSHDAGVRHGIERRSQLPAEVRAGHGKVRLAMTEGYKKEWLDVVQRTDATRVGEYQEFLDKTFATAHLTE